MAQITKRAADNIVGVFDGRTPCKDLAKQLKEKLTTECIKIKWRLILYKDSITGNPDTYELLGFVHKKDNPRIGKWHIIKGTRLNSEAIVYQLDQAGKETLFLQKVDDNILFFLDQEKNLMVGNKDFSYTLNRMAKKN
ncbi:MAG: hypothetical protein M3352_11090 [Bacteroidota bacterium]|nr:hypothetical protein [Bacteroidota bacterium]